MAKYKIDVFDSHGNLKTAIFDFRSLRIQDTANNIGKWVIKSATPYKQPFEPLDFAIFYRDGVYVYGGQMVQYTESYDKTSGMWEWEVTGYGFNYLLKNVLLYPSDSVDAKFTDRYYTSSRVNAYAIADLINKNASESARLGNRPAVSDIISGAVNNCRTSPQNEQEPYRFTDLFKACQALAEDSIFILPHFDTATKKVTFYIENGNANPIIFHSENGAILSYKHTYTIPTYTNLIANYNDDQDDAWKNRADIYLLQNIVYPGFQRKEVFYKPSKEQFGGSYSTLTLQKIAKQASANYLPETDNYEVTVPPTLYSFGYDRENDAWTCDYKIGDPVEFIMPDITLNTQVKEMQIDVSYGKESLKIGFGTIKKGAFTGIYSNLYNLNLSVSKSDTGEN